jgi:serine/threonine protein kinase
METITEETDEELFQSVNVKGVIGHKIPQNIRLKAEKLLPDLESNGIVLSGKYVNEGGFGFVIEGHNCRTNTKIVAKVIDLTKDNESDIRTELQIKKQLIHKNLIEIIYVTVCDDIKIVIMPFVEKDLFRFVTNIGVKDRQLLSESETRALYQQILSGVQFMHNNGFAHRDLKPENILITSNDVLKICDFDQTKLVYDENGLLIEEVITFGK